MRISVIIVSRDRRELLRKAVLAVLNQNLAKNAYEIIVIDDGSTDGTKEMIGELQKKHKNLLYLRQEKKGPAVGRNLGIRNSKAGLVAFTDNDSVADSEWLLAVLRAFDDKTVLGVEGKILSPEEKRLFHGAPSCEEGGKFMTCNMAFRKSVLDELGGFDESMVFWREDADLSFRVMKKGKIVFLSDAVVNHPLRRVPYFSLIKNLGFLKNDLLLFRRFPDEFKKYYGFPLVKESVLSLISMVLFLSVLYSLFTFDTLLLFLSVFFSFLWKAAEAFNREFSFLDLVVFMPLAFLRDLLFPLFAAYYLAVTYLRS